jgi:hypothetical protein
MRAALRRLGTPVLLPQFALLGTATEMFERALDGCKAARGNMGISRGRVQLRVPEKGLDVTDVRPFLEQLCRERMAKRMQADPLGDACSRGRLVKDAASALAVSGERFKNAANSLQL